MMTGASWAREQNRVDNARALCTIGASVGSTPTFATYAFSHVYLLFNNIQAHIAAAADATRLVCAICRHALGTQTILINPVSRRCV
jgi:hypothetical protein